ncbi:RINGv [Musa troglodytarum]|uniref:RINGv n=1 Tax=Musa troglodytarum TaxID=320322 RepID=A0A9E7GAW3_9LILI|nr:RINGv [Musa troglodytarum]
MTTATVTASVLIAVRPAGAECSGRGGGDGLGEEGEAAASKPPRDSVVAIDVPGVGADVAGAGDGKSEVEKVCRICHLSSGVGGLEVPNLIQLGCACKGELGSAHRRCAEAWFRVKGNRYCEICGANVKNVNGHEDGNFMESWNEGRMSGRSHRSSTEMNSCWRSQPFCNFLMACLVVAFILPWFFHINLF